ncbi:hypothetical protein [Flavobacterium tyrosinilyticum]|uniref:hypothetical protein n=1 Tax=Flavobacterium tyrosinilyticum TaxID=1658740 RepID=UPI0020300D55|nr:hypothetical protein [Flavobacterium tyrosinilyticum]MCM0665511.1 hypothetical protein [Flavobacterium tyrosinilyticum]
MRDINEINQLYIKARELCKRDIFDIEKPVNEKAILPLQDLKQILNNYLIDNPNNIIALRLMCFVECYLSDFNTALIYLEKAVMLNGDNKDKFKLSKLAEIARNQNILMLDLKSMGAKQLNFHKTIKSIITNIKNELDKDPSSMIFAQFSSGLKGISRKEASNVGIYYDFLQISNVVDVGLLIYGIMMIYLEINGW